MRKYVKNIKIAKNLLKSSLTTLDVLYLIMLHINGNVDKKFQLSIFYRSRDNPPLFLRQTDGRTDGRKDISNYRVASLLKRNSKDRKKERERKKYIGFYLLYEPR